MKTSMTFVCSVLSRLLTIETDNNINALKLIAKNQQYFSALNEPLSE